MSVQLINIQNCCSVWAGRRQLTPRDSFGATLSRFPARHHWNYAWPHSLLLSKLSAIPDVNATLRLVRSVPCGSLRNFAAVDCAQSIAPPVIELFFESEGKS